MIDVHLHAVDDLGKPRFRQVEAGSDLRQRSRDLMRSGAPIGRMLPGRVGLEIRTTVQGGMRILEKLEHARYDMFRDRPTLKWHDWPILLARAL